MNETFQRQMREATRLTQAGRLSEATAVIQRALGGAAAPADAGPAALEIPSPWVIDGCVFEVAEAVAPAPVQAPSQARPRPSEPAAPDVAANRTRGPGEFSSGTHAHGGIARGYKLYLPPGAAPAPMPLVVMLHGCTQDPDDFAVGTAMNERAREQGFAVLYPAQAQDANPQRCWNWFKHNHQQRGCGEPALLASLTQTVTERHGLDSRRVYIAGLSAGGAMAALVASAYPELFAAVGVHSGLPAGAATDLPGALTLMRSGVAGPTLPRKGARTSRPAAAKGALHRPVPTIVFHGDQDPTVHPRNGEQVIAAALAGCDATALPATTTSSSSGSTTLEQGESATGRRYTRSCHRDAEGRVLAEHWLVHGAGHAWSGGHANGTFTDARGPDATREMLRFFFEQPLRPAR